jgi:hypothetical protein
LVTVFYQVMLLYLALSVGYNLVPFRHPQPPDDLPHDAATTGLGLREVIAEEYARACEEREAASASAGRQVSEIGRAFVRSLILGLLVTITLSFLMTFIAPRKRALGPAVGRPGVGLRWSPG